MSPTKILFCFFFIAVSNINFAKSFVCPPDACASVLCLAIKDCEPNQVLKQGGFCNCCNQCFTILRENETCGTPLQAVIMGAAPPTAECDKGLVCLDGICQKIKI